MSRSILIYGAGVIGCELAHVLKEGGNGVTLLARGEWKNTLEKQGLVIRHYLQKKTTTDEIRVIDQLDVDDKYDVIFVVMQADQIFEVLPIVAANASRHVVLVGNNPWAERAEQLIHSASQAEKEVAFAFVGVGGRRENGQVVSIHAGVPVTVGGREKSLSPDFQRLLLDVFSKSGCKLSWESKMDAWLKCHMAEILPMAYVAYAVDCDLTNASAPQRKAMIDAAKEGFALLKALGYPIRPAGDEDFFTSGPKRNLWGAAMFAVCKTPVGRLAVTDHCAHAVSEIAFLDSAWEELRRRKPDLPMPVWDSLRKNMPVEIHARSGINPIFRVKTDGFHGELFRPEQDRYPGNVLICFTGSDGRFEMARMLAQVFQSHGLTTLALAYVMEDGLPDCFYHVPIDTLEAAAKRMHEMGYEKVGLWGISKGAELALMAASLLPGLVNAVVAVAPMNIACQGFSKKKGMTVMPGSSWSFHGEEVPYNSFGIEKFPTGQVLRKSLKARELTMYDLYLPLVNDPNPDAIIRVENITGPILLLTSKMDTMWPSEPAAKQIMERLREQKFPYYCRHLSYNHSSHLLVPVELSLAKFFVGDRGKYKERSRRARMDSLEKTLEFVSRW